MACHQWIFEHSVPGLPEAAAAQGLTPLAYMRTYGAFEVTREVYNLHNTPYMHVASTEGSGR